MSRGDRCPRRGKPLSSRATSRRAATSPSLGKFCDRTRDAWTAPPPPAWNTRIERARHVLVCDQASFSLLGCLVHRAQFPFPTGHAVPCAGRMKPPSFSLRCDLARPGSYRTSFFSQSSSVISRANGVFSSFEAAKTEAYILTNQAVVPLPTAKA